MVQVRGMHVRLVTLSLHGANINISLRIILEDVPKLLCNSSPRCSIPTPNPFRYLPHVESHLARRPGGLTRRPGYRSGQWRAQADQGAASTAGHPVCSEPACQRRETRRSGHPCRLQHGESMQVRAEGTPHASCLGNPPHASPACAVPWICHPPLSPLTPHLQLEFAVAFLGTTLARAVAAPLNQNNHKVCMCSCSLQNGI